ncbi:hypothetical protein HDV05_007121 [Chytridiales sp. JEL 0842]|nr:hypothetical protein HDV05_007121 [Chytridiales sp. JEL 0842]
MMMLPSAFTALIVALASASTYAAPLAPEASSSILKLTLFSEINFSGTTKDLTVTEQCLSLAPSAANFNNMASSAVWTGPPQPNANICFYEEVNCSGAKSRCFSWDERSFPVNFDDFLLDDLISAVRIVYDTPPSSGPPPRLVLYSDVAFTGQIAVLPDLTKCTDVPADFNDVASSLTWGGGPAGLRGWVCVYENGGCTGQPYCLNWEKQEFPNDLRVVSFNDRISSALFFPRPAGV